MGKNKTYDSLAYTGHIAKRVYSSSNNVDYENAYIPACKQIMTRNPSAGPYSYDGCYYYNQPFNVYWNSTFTKACCFYDGHLIECPDCIWNYV